MWSFLFRLISEVLKEFAHYDATRYPALLRYALSEFRLCAVYLTHARPDPGHETLSPPAPAKYCPAPAPDRAVEGGAGNGL